MFGAGHGADGRHPESIDIAGTASPGAYNPRDYKAVAAVQAHGVSMLITIDLAAGRARVISPLLTNPVGLTFTR